ncbi:hypothetical protein BofuT4_uP063990.1 [Botrytis cinerea T4]|uniref:Uncharacterized protein n=1 Tax=Botryotinia fuckeliana (strain T4) TaxID=999810 RepID=G2XSS9_BOTF4|nr:hypothetical protein BofuT4_uP063990.1 [Botrytis cinerea T4]
MISTPGPIHLPNLQNDRGGKRSSLYLTTNPYLQAP